MLLTSGRDEPSPREGPVTQAIPPQDRSPDATQPKANAVSKNKFARTMLGLAPLPPAPSSSPPAPAGSPPEKAEANGGEKHTPIATAKAANAGRSKHGTMLGLAFPLPQAEKAAGAPVPRQAAQAATLPEAPDPDKPPDTLIGAGEFATPGPAPLPFKAANRGTLMGTGDFVPAGPAPVPFNDAAKGTLIGVAVPGIAPINPGVPKTPAAESTSSIQHETPGSEPPSGSSPATRTSSSSHGRALLWALVGVAVALGLVAFAAIWRWRVVPKLDVQVESDEAGHDVLSIECKNCDDTVSFALGDAKSPVRNHLARLPLRTPLKIGPNDVTVSMMRGTSRPEAIRLQVPVDFRVTGDATGLDENPTKLRLRIEKTPSVDFQVNHEPILFGPDGKGVFELDISSELIGPSAQTKTLEKKVSYQVRSAGGTFESTSTLRAAVTPLVVTAPGAVLVTEGTDLKICGHSDPGARVEIAGLQSSIDKQGGFCNAAVIREFGRFEVWVSAKQPGAAARRVKLTIERTANLREYAKSLFPRVAHEVATDRNLVAASPQDLVALTGVVVEQSQSPEAARYLLRTDSTGATSFARVTSFSSTPAKVGTHLTIFGEVTESLAGPDGRKMPELTAAFEVPALH